MNTVTLFAFIFSCLVLACLCLLIIRQRETAAAVIELVQIVRESGQSNIGTGDEAAYMREYIHGLQPRLPASMMMQTNAVREDE